MERKDILKNPEYWTTKTQLDLYECAQKFMEKHGLDRTRLAEHLGVSKGYVTQLLNGDYDHRMSKFFELALSFGVVPKIEFIPIEKYIELDGQIKTYKEYIKTPVVIVSATYNIAFIAHSLGVKYLSKRTLVNNPDTYYFLLDEIFL